ncbi:hypothetical protein N9Q54_00070 [Octadecabacter sp.]|nr:hypothetical protein [Octadecabacter sp.]
MRHITVMAATSSVALMADKPVVGVDLNTGLITVDLPDQMPDEALSLPAPSADEVVETLPEEVKPAA